MTSSYDGFDSFIDDWNDASDALLRKIAKARSTETIDELLEDASNKKEIYTRLAPFLRQRIPSLPTWQAFVYGLFISSAPYSIIANTLIYSVIGGAILSSVALTLSLFGVLTLGAVLACAIATATVLAYNFYKQVKPKREELLLLTLQYEASAVLRARISDETTKLQELSDTVVSQGPDDIVKLLNDSRKNRSYGDLIGELGHTAILFFTLLSLFQVLTISVMPLIPALATVSAFNPILVVPAVAVFATISGIYLWRLHKYNRRTETAQNLKKTLIEKIAENLEHINPRREVRHARVSTKMAHKRSKSNPVVAPFSTFFADPDFSKDKEPTPADQRHSLGK